MLFCRVALPLSCQTLTFVSGLVRTHRREVGSPWRALNPGHAHITTTEIYTAPTPDEVIAHVLAHHSRQRTQRARPPAPPAPGYRPEVLATLFGTNVVGGEPDDHRRS